MDKGKCFIKHSIRREREEDAPDNNFIKSGAAVPETTKRICVAAKGCSAHAAVVQRQDTGFPSRERGFESRPPLHKTKQRRINP